MLQGAGILDLFDDVLSSSMPKKYESKGQFLMRFLVKQGALGTAALHADDSHQAIESILTNPSGATAPVCHSLRLPYMGEGLTAADFRLIATAFLYRCVRGLAADDAGSYFGAYSFAHGGAAVVDAGDAAVKCMLDGMDAEALAEVIQQNKGAEHLASWLDGRPDYAEYLEA
mmetsp:Transcript_18967/g.57627  ORF Transcript_18967/g.57627 Transcript_18967/m.57627 type:complete len:172 (+) Transcript_18967:176-691(+)